MSEYSVCILDDKIPVTAFNEIEVNETSLIDNNLITHYLKTEAKWKDVDLFKFTSKLQQEKYRIFGFTRPSFYLNYVDENIFRPDIIIFDWETGDNDVPENLIEILRTSYILVGIFTDANNNKEITKKITEPEFKEFEHKFFLIEKDNGSAYIKLLEEINIRKEHFSFKKGKELIKQTLNAMDNVISNLGALSYDQFISLFGTATPTGGREISAIDYCDIILEKLKVILIDRDLGNLVTSRVDEITDSIELRKLWNYRLYSSPTDQIVRRGDIISQEGNEEEMFLIISSDCHLKEFWNKNLGYLTLVPIKKISMKTEFTNMLKQLNLNKKFNNLDITSLVSSKDGLTILPGIQRNEGSYEDYLVIPKSILSICIKKNTGSNKFLCYSDLSDYKSDKRIRIIEPFLTPLIQYITDNITGNGVSDYSPKLRDSIRDNLNKVLENEK